MNLATDILKTVAILDDNEYTRVAERMAHATEGIGQGAWMDRLSKGMTVAGGMMTALGASAIKAAAQRQQTERSFDSLYGKAAKPLYDNLQAFTYSTPYTFQQWTEWARELGGFNVKAQDTIPMLKAIGDGVTTAFGHDPQRMQRVILAIGEMNEKFLSMRQINQLSMAGINAQDYLEKNLHLTKKQMSNVGAMHIPSEVGMGAIMKGMMDDDVHKDGMKKGMDTVIGQVTNLQDAWNQFMSTTGQPFLEPTQRAITFISDKIQWMTDKSRAHVAGELMVFGGPAMLVTAAVLKATQMWNGFTTAKNLAKIASQQERTAELDKLPVLETETAQVETATSRWSAFGSTIASVAAKGAMLAGLAVAIQGVADASEALSGQDGADRVNFDAHYQDYRKNRWAAAGSDLWHLPRTLQHAFTGGFGGADSFERFAGSGQRIVTNSRSPEAIAAFNRLVPRLKNVEGNWSHTSWQEVNAVSERLNSIVQSAKGYKDTGGQAGDAFAAKLKRQQDASRAEFDASLKKFRLSDYEKPKKGKKPSAAADPLDQADMAEDRSETEMKIAGLRYQRTGAKADHDAYNAARKATLGLIDQEVAGLARHAAAIEHVAGKAKEWLTTEKKVQSLMEKHEELESDKLDKDKRSKLDKAAATILGGGGLGEEEILKRAGIGGAFFARLDKGKMPQSPLKSALQALAKRPLVLNLHLGDKPFAQIKSEIKDDAIRALLQAFETSNPRALFGN